MPEGPEIKRAADRIARALVNQQAIEVFFAFDRLKPFESLLSGRTVIAVQPKGKALLTRFDNDLTIYSHNQLYGRWEIRSAYRYPETKRQLRLAIHTAKKSALLYSASDIQVLDPEAIALHPFLNRLGLDVLDPETTIEQVIDRFTDKRFYRRNFLVLLLDQGFLGGLGNYLRSEILFVARLHPSLRPIDCTPDQIARLSEAAIALPWQSYNTAGITNDLQLAETLKARGYHRSSYRHWVFNREGKPCFVCETAIVKAFSGGRRYYYCPVCQAAPQKDAAID
ncbi:endonuclease VIII [Microcoleus sp. FACHB-1515]|uniref:endonuclease VIII n=1 Tax=Cyanophyceae TaxID=3028117 RepID=UPI001684EAD5|nr:endonuclease VIII [Microcoleus sp. FACHB-1515]MBD2089329.1 endonuclease VIII [Microcoleus sp. FACHB-1515]